MFKLAPVLKSILHIISPELKRNVLWYKNRITRRINIKRWEALGRPLPPPHQYKQLVVEKVAKENGLKCLLETGSFLGHMIEAQKKNFEQILSIELDETLYKNVQEKFTSTKHIKIYQGDSSEKLSMMLDTISGKTVLFWLDGHFSGPFTARGTKICPIYEELNQIFKYKFPGMYILIDDARLFVGADDYPTMAELDQFIKKKNSELQLKVANDIIHIS